MKISIAMATYNGERFLLEQLQSIALQTCLPFELVVCDDGSSDHTINILETFTKQAPFRVRIFENSERLGYGDNFLRAANLCEGDWIGFCDQDDIWLPEKCEVVADVLRRNSGILAVTHSADVVGQDLQKTGRRLPDFKRDMIVDALELPLLGHFFGFSTVFSRFLVDQFAQSPRPVHPVNPSIRQSHDQWIYVLANSLGRTARISRSLALYRRHDATVSGDHAPTAFRAMLSQSLKTGTTAYLHQARYLSECATYLEKIVNGSRGTDAERLRNAARLFAEFSSATRERSAIYSRDIPARFKSFYKLILTGRYRGDTPNGFGRRAALKDAAALMIPFAR